MNRLVLVAFFLTTGPLSLLAGHMPPGVPLPPKVLPLSKDDLALIESRKKGAKASYEYEELSTPGMLTPPPLPTTVEEKPETVQVDKKNGERVPLDFVNLGSSAVLNLHNAYHGIFRDGNVGTARLTLLGKENPFGFSYLHSGDKDQPLQYASRFLHIEGTWFTPEMSKSKKFLTLYPYDGPLGDLELDFHFGSQFEVSVLVLRNEKGDLFTLGASKGLPHKIRLPVGEYHLAGATVRQIGKDAPLVHIIPPRLKSVIASKKKLLLVSQEGVAKLTLGGKIWSRRTPFGTKSERERFLEEVVKLKGVGGEGYEVPEEPELYRPRP
ncbi:MAG: hypothetical protein AB7F75_02335 [Planctomycetota bacterium]